MAGISIGRVVAVIAELDTGLTQIGSGYLLDARRVLTARHCAYDAVTGRPATALRVVRASGGASAAVTVDAASPELDVAVLTPAGDPPPAWAAADAGSAFEAVTFARIDRDESGVLEGCEAVGFPMWQNIDPGGYRDVAELHGRIYAMEGRERRRLVMRDPTLTGVGWSRGERNGEGSSGGPGGLGSSGGGQVWSGLSGSAVFQDELLLGVVIEHHPGQGPSSVQIRPIDVIPAAGDPDAARLGEVLGLGRPDAFRAARTRAGVGTTAVAPPPPAPGQPLAEFTDPFTLEVHRAIDTGTPGVPVLPPYIERDHDAPLRSVVAGAAAGRSASAVLVGGSSTGKTRACWEAIHAAGKPLEGWTLWNPVDADEAADDLAHVAPRTIIWLNNTQLFLYTPGRDVGDRVAAGLRRLLRSPGRGPVLILGTIWHDYWAILTTPPGDGEPDPHANARALLADNGIPVPDTFSAADQRALHVVSASDPRLAAARREAVDGLVTQYLAAAPALLERYRTARPAARALIEAAMDARRLGHGPDLPVDMLEAAVPGYLTPAQWNALGDTWLQDALTYATTLCVGAAGVFAKPRPRPGQAPAPTTVYRLADYLEQHGRARRKAASPPVDLWAALTGHAERSELPALGEEAKARHLTETAARLYAAAVRAGDEDAPRQAADLLEKAGYVTDAIRFYQRAGEAGDVDAFMQAARLLEDAGEDSEALAAYQRVAEAGRTEALWPAATLLKQAGRFDEAVACYLHAPDPSESTAGFLLDRAQALSTEHQGTELLDLAQRAVGYSGIQRRKIERAMREYTAQAAAVIVEGLTPLIDLGPIDQMSDALKAAGDREELKAVAESIVERLPSDPEAPDLSLVASSAMQRMAAMSLRLAGLLEPVSSTPEGIAFYRRAAEAGVGAYAMRWVALRMASQGKRDEVLAWLFERADAGDDEALLQAADLLGRAGRIDAAVAFYRRAADHGDPDALTAAAELLGEAGRVDEAGVFYAEAAGDDPDILAQAATLFGAAGRVDEAVDLYERAARSGDPEPLAAAAELLGEAGRVDEAVDFYRRAIGSMAEDRTRGIEEATALIVKAGDLLLRDLRVKEAMEHYATVAQAGDEQAAIEGYERVAEIADTIADAFVEQGDEESATGLRELGVLLYEHIAESGHRYARFEVVRRRKRLGQVEQAITWLQEIVGGSEPTDGQAMAIVFRMMREVGREDEAVEWLQRTAAAGSVEARLRAADVLTGIGLAEETLEWLTTLAQDGVDGALGQLSDALRGTDRIDDAIGRFEQVARGGNAQAWLQGMWFLVREGRSAEAWAWLQARLAEMVEAGRRVDAIILLQAAAGVHEWQGDLPDALSEYSALMRPFTDDMQAYEIPVAWDRARVLAKSDRVDEAIEFYQDAADAGAPDALSRAATALAEAGHVDEMIAWLLRRAEAGDAAALAEAFVQAAACGRTEEAIVGYERAAQSGDAAALEHVAGQLADADLLDQAMAFYLRAAEAGRIHAFDRAKTLLEDHERADEAARLARLGIAPGGTPAAEWQLSELLLG